MKHSLNIVASLAKTDIKKLVERIDQIPLFAHAYSHHLNMRLGTMSPGDMLAFAQSHHLQGLNIHVEDGEDRSLASMSTQDRKAFGAAAAAANLIIHIETSSTAYEILEQAVTIAHDVKARSIRCYPRYQGRVTSIIAQTIADLEKIETLDPGGQLQFTLEQHEDLKSHELVQIVQGVNNPRLSLLFDFGNMINAYERPEDALEQMAPLITEVHIKDVKMGDDKGGWAQIACRSGEGAIDFPGFLARLLLLGDDEQQVRAFALQEENGMVSQAFRFPNEEVDPFIPWREASTTDLPADEPLNERLARESREASEQVAYVHSILSDLKQAALIRLADQPDN